MTTIQEKIGARIAAGRKALGLTMKALAEKTENLKPSRINNWERGARTPGPEEAVQLAKALGISAAYLLGLTDDVNAGLISRVPGLLKTVPLLTFEQACNPDASLGEHHKHYIPLSDDLEGKVSENTFALRIKDDSMNPSLRVGDIIVVEPSDQPNPGDLVVAKLHNAKEVIVRQYKQTSYSGSFELIANNANWPNATINSEKEGLILGVVLESRHYY